MVQYKTPYPVIVGHEIVGEVVRVGSQAAGNHKVGDRVGVGCLADNCEGQAARVAAAAAGGTTEAGGDQDGAAPCASCAAGHEQFCARARWTYPGRHHNGDRAHGGHATYHRTPGRFAFAVPAGLASAHAATMMCAGVTMYAPLRQWGCGPGARVGIVGLGGLGHYGVLFARALGADLVVAISRREAKRAEALRLGAHDYLATMPEEAEAGADEDRDKEATGAGADKKKKKKKKQPWFAKYAGQLDLVISTVASARAPLAGYLALLRPRGTLVHVGHPDDGPFVVPPAMLVPRALNFAGACVGSAAETRAMLALAARAGLAPWVEERPMRAANQALRDLRDGKARYRLCLVNGEPAARL